MTRVKQPQGFPQAYYKVIESVSNTGKPFTFARADRRKAELLRFQIYAFIKACRASTDQKMQLIGQQAYTLVFSVRGNDLVISLRDNENEAQELEAAIAEYERDAGVASVSAGNNPPGTIPVASNTMAQPTQAHNAPRGDSHEDMINQFMNKDKGK